MWKTIIPMLAASLAAAAPGPRHESSLNAGWRTVATEPGPGFEKAAFDDSAWQAVDVPHNWDDYGGAHRLVHGNRHGTAWYRRRFEVDAAERGRRVFLFFEGVGSYATVWVNGKPAGKHAGGRTTFTLDVTDLVEYGKTNVLAVRADHPAEITDLPWVCGGCAKRAGFSEGSQPMGIFRPVRLVTTETVRVEPFGVHVWNDTTMAVSAETEVRNYGSEPWAVVVVTRVLDRAGKAVAGLRGERALTPAFPARSKIGRAHV